MTIHAVSFKWFWTLVPSLFLVSLFGFPMNPNALHAQEMQLRPGLTLVSTRPATIPAWVDEHPEVPGKEVFVGSSGRAATEQSARKNALDNGRYQMVQYIGQKIRDEMRRIARDLRYDSETADAQTASVFKDGSLARATASRLKDRAYYTEVYRDVSSSSGQSFVVKVRMDIAIKDLEQAIEQTRKDRQEEIEMELRKETDAAKIEALKAGGKLWENFDADSLFKDDV